MNRWRTPQGLVVPDRVPVALRREWVAAGHCPDADLYQLFRERVRAHPERAALVTATESLSYRELDAQVQEFAALLAGRGQVAAGEVVALRLPNGVPAVAAELAVAALGAVALTFPDGPGSSEARALLRRSRATVLVAARTDLPGARLPYLRAVLTPEEVRPAGFVRPARPDPDSPARVLVSSGSEAEPKMVAYSHNAMAGGRGNYLRAVYAGTPVPRPLVLVPLAASYGSLGVVSLYRHGATLVLLDRFDPAAALRAVTEHRATHLFGVATMLRRMTALAPEPGEDLSSLRAVVASCDGLPPELLAACLDRFGCPVSNLYGSSDGVNCRAEYGSPVADTTLLGRPDPAVCEFATPTAAPGEAGELWARGPMTPLCYLGAPELDAARRCPQGWVRTGDHGRLTSRGELQLLRRNSQLIKRGGYSVSPVEVERHLGAHPALAEAVCVAVPDPDLGERLCACVVPAPGRPAPTLPELRHFLETTRGLERRKLPEQLLTLPTLPLTPTGKLARTELATLARGATGS
ncbi:AMP-dependent synthetase [Streptomyces tateyamensis]|uniref:AMP-dependent synthetase n=1 Tax=Streptomyces tateyamensis TaxID=565073 RepID=A0A2V4NZ23_9ACTN|nr:fatty acid--CoA ligase family protein [Streptomyces tateyamensis]PYC69534.1 AMP-dependent synthetase [Streptomyces tateyamensis]